MVNNIMLAVHCKKSDSVDLKTPIWNYIAATYGEHQANDASEDLAAVQQLRSDVVGLAGALPVLRETVAKYYRALSSMETRFPISRDRDHVQVSFTWYDAFRPTKRAEQYNIHFEKAAVLFNLAALLSQQALACDRSTDQGRRDAARKFQEAAGAFATLKEGACLRVEAPRPADLTPECAGLLERLMLAQAQEATWEKAVADKKNPAVLARLAKQVAIFYDEVGKYLTLPVLAAHFDRSWVAHSAAKGALYEVEAQAAAAAALHASDDVAPEITRLKEALARVVVAKKEAKACGKELQDHAKGLEDQLTLLLARAERENSTVYLQRVPALADLPPIAGAPLVKPIAPGDLDAAADGLFASVIPDTSAKALSKYSEMVDGLIRQQMDKLEAASDEARLRLREWEMPEALQALEAGSAAALPEALRAQLEGLEDHGGVRHLHDLAAQIRELRAVAADDLTKVEGQLEAEAREDADLRAAHPGKWARPASAALNSGMREKLAGYRANLAAAGESDARLEARLTDNNATFAALTIDAAVAQMPRLQAPMLAVGDLEPASIVAALRSALEQLNSVSAERASLEQALKEEKNRDNILPKLMASADNYDALFKAELGKYQPFSARVDTNVARQAQLLQVIGTNQAAYRTAFGFAEWRKACEAAGSAMRAGLAAYGELRDNLSEGLRFYMSLQEAIKTLAQQVGDFVLTRAIQRDDMVEDIRKAGGAAAAAEAEARERAARERTQQQLAAMNLHSQPSAPQAYPPPYQGGQPGAPAYHAPPQTQQPQQPPQQQQHPPHQPYQGAPPPAYQPPLAPSPVPGGQYGHTPPGYYYQQQAGQPGAYAPHPQYPAQPQPLYPPQQYYGQPQQQQQPPPNGQQQYYGGGPPQYGGPPPPHAGGGAPGQHGGGGSSGGGSAAPQQNPLWGN